LISRVTVGFSVQQSQFEQVQARLKSAQLGDASLPREPNFAGYYTVTLHSTDTALSRLRETLRASGIEWSERRENVYGEDELRRAPLLLFLPDARERGRGGPTCGTEFDLSTACRCCGTGAQQVSPLRLDASNIPKKGTLLLTLDHETAFSTAVAQRLLDSDVSGLELRQIEACKTGERLPWFQMLADVELPPMTSSTSGLVRSNPCHCCARDGYFDSGAEPLEPVYSARELVPEELPDVVHTYEHFGNSVLRDPISESHFAQPRFLIKPRIWEILKEERVAPFTVIPVRIDL